jgi:hypothetical protein
MRSFLLPLLFLLTAAAPPETARLRGEAARVSITRDDGASPTSTGPATPMRCSA